MKKIIIASFVLLGTFSCKKEQIEPKTETKVIYASFGDKIVADNALTKEQVIEKYNSLKEGDTIDLKFATKINEICQNKGCWMTLDLGNDQKSFVKFKDYAFFVPMNAQNREAVVEGKAFIEETSVAELKHYAEDEGKPQASIDSIKEPKKELKFLAHGVLIAK